MAEASIPVDLFNPGQVFACLGFLEVAEVLLGDAEGGFDWQSNSGSRFLLSTRSGGNPFATVLSELAVAKLTQLAPVGWPDGLPEGIRQSQVFPSPMVDHYVKQDKKWSMTKMPFEIKFSNRTSLMLSHWTDGSSRQPFKLYSGNRSACSIASDMLNGKRSKPSKTRPQGKLVYSGLSTLVENDIERLVVDPFGVTCALGGSFNLDPCGGWTQIDAGFSLNRHSHISIVASPVIEVLGLFGLEHSRPTRFTIKESDGNSTEWLRYAAWTGVLPVAVARAAMTGTRVGVHAKRFRYTTAFSGKNKVNTYANEENIG